MCVSNNNATFFQTVTGVTKCWHEGRNCLVHSLVYQNTAQNLHSGPNALLLHLPTHEIIGPEHFISTKGFSDFTEDIQRSLEPRGKGLSFSGPEAISLEPPEAVVFEHGIYHMVAANDLSQVMDALEQVPEQKRPEPNWIKAEWYARELSGYTIVYTCFNNEDAIDADPLLLFYEPANPDFMVIPGIDHHGDTGTPDLDAMVKTDHFVFFGSAEPQLGLRQVNYTVDVSEEAAWLLPINGVGRAYESFEPNADFVAPADILTSGDPGEIERRVLDL